MLDDIASFKEHTEVASAVTIGVFDGVHVGHRAIMRECVREARARGLASVALTFDRNPRKLICGESPCVLTERARKIRVISEQGLDYLVIARFDEEFAVMEPEAFCSDVLARDLDAKLVCVGENFNFGKSGRGDAVMLATRGKELGFEVIVVPLMKVDGEYISSTLIRRRIVEGKVSEVTGGMGRPYSIRGKVVLGHHRGKMLGFPTANLSLEKAFCVPKDGVYAGKAVLENRRYTCAVNIGSNPTFGDDETALEVFLLDFEGELYGETLEVEFYHRLRDEVKFESGEALRAQMRRDVEEARELMGGAP